MALQWHPENESGRLTAKSQVWQELRYCIEYSGDSVDWTASFEGGQLAQGSLLAMLEFCEADENKAKVEALSNG